MTAFGFIYMRSLPFSIERRWLSAAVLAITARLVKMRRRQLRTFSSYRNIINSLSQQHHARFANSAGDSVLA
jgi:hypothetical protein